MYILLAMLILVIATAVVVGFIGYYLTKPDEPEWKKHVNSTRYDVPDEAGHRRE